MWTGGSSVHISDEPLRGFGPAQRWATDRHQDHAEDHHLVVQSTFPGGWVHIKARPGEWTAVLILVQQLSAHRRGQHHRLSARTGEDRVDPSRGDHVNSEAERQHADAHPRDPTDRQRPGTTLRRAPGITKRKSAWPMEAAGDQRTDGAV
jgi:hypothetical protein